MVCASKTDCPVRGLCDHARVRGPCGVPEQAQRTPRRLGPHVEAGTALAASAASRHQLGNHGCGGDAIAERPRHGLANVHRDFQPDLVVQHERSDREAEVRHRAIDVLDTRAFAEQQRRLVEHDARARGWCRSPADRRPRSPSCPSCAERFTAASTARSAAASGRMTSSSGIRSAGEKKCMPTIRSGCARRRRISWIGMADVFEAMTASGASTFSSSATTVCLTLSSSNTASITRSVRAKPL